MLTFNRRVVIAGLASCASDAVTRHYAKAGFVGDALGFAKSYFVEAAQVMSGWSEIDLVYGLDKAVRPTRDLIKHMDATIPLITSVLASIQGFITDCDEALRDIEGLLKNLPSQIGEAFDTTEAKQQLGVVQGQCANMSSYLFSRGSIHTNSSRIQSICEDIVEKLGALAQLERNDFQFTMHAVPALTIWAHGYTAYNSLLETAKRSVNPWDHEIVKGICLPRIERGIAAMLSERANVQQMEPNFAVKTGVVYKYDDAKKFFMQTDIPFKWAYKSDEVGNDIYYCTCPNAMVGNYPSDLYRNTDLFHPAPDASVRGPYTNGLRISYLMKDLSGGPRRWSYWPFENQENWQSMQNWINNDPKAEDARIFIKAVEDGIDAKLSEYNRIADFYAIALDIDKFNKKVEEHLVKGKRQAWAKMPIMPT